MRHLQPRQYFAATQRAIANGDAIEWEELPSLATDLARSRLQRGANDTAFGTTMSGSVWDNTLPAALDPAPASPPFDERLPGLSAREVYEPEVFVHFFGT